MLRNVAVKEWLEEGHNYWKIVDRYFVAGSGQRNMVVKMGQQLDK